MLCVVEVALGLDLTTRHVDDDSRDLKVKKADSWRPLDFIANNYFLLSISVSTFLIQIGIILFLRKSRASE